jgi:DNA gyrase subunit B
MRTVKYRFSGAEAVKVKARYVYRYDLFEGLHHLYTKFVDNSIDDALAGYCVRITVILNKERSGHGRRTTDRGVPRE